METIQKNKIVKLVSCKSDLYTERFRRPQIILVPVFYINLQIEFKTVKYRRIKFIRFNKFSSAYKVRS